MSRLKFIVATALATLAAPLATSGGAPHVLSRVGFSESAPANLQAFVGVYQLSSKQFVYVQPWPGDEGGRKLAYSDEAGQIRALSPVSDHVFTAGPGLLVPSPVEIRISFVRDSQGKITSLIRHRDGRPDQAAKKLDAYGEQDVIFHNGAQTLAGTLFTPAGKGPHPALVLIGGSGAADRYSVLPIVHFLVTNGFALLGYDKRGAGGSPGDWRTASLEDLASDALAAVQFLKSCADIDARRIGLFGASQGGWVAPLAASQSNDVAFVITLSGPAMSPAEVELERLDHSLHALGFPPDAIQHARALVQLANDVARGKEPWANLQAALGQSRPAKWFPYVSVPLSPDSWLLEHWRGMPLDYDPAPVIANLHVPVLALFGALDQTVLPQKNADSWQAALSESKTRDYAVKIFPRANHMLLEAQTGMEQEFPTLQRFTPEFAPLLLNWLRQRR